MADSPSAPPAATHSIHRTFLESSSPPWLVGTTSARREQLKAAPVQPPDWFLRATPQQQKTLTDKYTASLTAQTALDKTFATLQDIDTFAKPLLVKALQEQFKVQLDVDKTILQLRTQVEILQPQATYSTFEVLRLPLLQAALHNFEASECKEGAFDASSGFVTESSEVEKFDPVSTSLTVAQFTGLCRSLDIGAQYQRYLNDFVRPKDNPVAEQVLRQKFIAARKADLAAAAEQALLTKDIGPDDYQMIVSVINGENHPWMGKRQVWFCDVSLMRKRMVGCVAFVISETRLYIKDLILYIPHDPYHPLKRVTVDQMEAIFKERFTTRDTPDPDDGSPTAYHRFFSQFVKYGDLPTYFGELCEITPAPGTIKGLTLYSPFLRHFLRGVNPFSVRKVQPNPEPIRRLAPDPFLRIRTFNQKGVDGWDVNLDLWDYLFEEHREKLLADARSHAVPTADVDARVRSEKLASLLGIGFLALNLVSMFVPVLGPAMMVVMANQLLYETMEGFIEWGEGDRRAAKAHLVDVAGNLAFLALMAGIGKGFGKLAAVKPEPVIEQLEMVTLPQGQKRLRRADLTGYESPVTLPPDVYPNAQGEYLLDGKSYFRQLGNTYEKTFDEDLDHWRVKHPSDPEAYQPLLHHNSAGAWSTHLDRPLTWDRTTLMRRLGHVTDGFTDEQLSNIADISGVSDDALRKMHVDRAPPPAELADALRLFKADQDVAQVIEQVSSGQAVDGRYLYTLPLVTEMPRWPAGRVLEVFDGPGLTGNSQRYGVERLYPGARRKPVIGIARADVVSSKLPAHILAALDESEVVSLLGGEAARVRDSRPQEFRKQLADYALSRQPALFESLYKGHEVPDPFAAKLQRLYPGLSEAGAKSVLAQADAEELARFHTRGRVPLGMEEQARWHVRQGRLGYAYAGLHKENMAAASSKRLALHTLSKLPGWSDQVRLEVRDGTSNGNMLDSIGSENAEHRKYLVKRGPVYQAFNERGEELNSLPRHGDNFYASIMHALPDEARQALGIPHVGQSLDLRRAIIDYAAAHRVESAQIVEDAPARQSWFNPPRRVAATVLGYPASGRGDGARLLLANRAQALYPLMSEVQADEFIRTEERVRGRDGVVALLENRRQEWEQLVATLDAWEATPPDDPFMQSYLGGDPRQRVAQRIKQCWQQRPLVGFPRYDELVLDGDVVLPPLSADFSHVHALVLKGRGIIERNIGQLLGYFPQLQALTVVGTNTALAPVLDAIQTIPRLNRLHIESSIELGEAQQLQLESLTQIQDLALRFSATSTRPLDVSRMRRLISLTLYGEARWGFPSGVFELPDLENLDLRIANIETLPAQLFEPGGERLWPRLSLNWSKLNREDFKTAFDYVKSQPVHLFDQEEMVRDYCVGRFYDHLGRPQSSNPTSDFHLRLAFMERWPTVQAKFDAMEALSTEYGEWVQGLESWVNQSSNPVQRDNRVNIATELRTTWYRGLFSRYGLTPYPTLELPYIAVSELPRLPAEGIAHVTDLSLPHALVPTAQMNAFIRGFSALRTLNLKSCGLAELTVVPGGWSSLTHLNLSRNPLVALDVSGLSALEVLNLHGSTLATWPTGAEQLPELEWLDLRNTKLTELPDAVLAHDRMLLDTNLLGTPLTSEAHSALATARHRIEHRLGLSEGTLSAFEQRPVSNEFPPNESGSGLALLLLPLPAPAEGTLSLEQQLHRLYPAMDVEEAGQWLERLRDEGLSDLQVRARIDGWEQTLDALTRQLNGWIFTRRLSFGFDRMVTANTRQLAAKEILDRWLNGVSGRVVEAGRELSFHGMTLGELPALSVTLEHVDTLNLNGVQLSAQGSNGFLRAFPRLQTLVLSSNPLGTLPDALAEMPRLRRLELSGVDFDDPQYLHATLVRLGPLQWLDLSHCELESFQLTGFDRLEHLDLSNNELTQWPDDTLTARSLRTLKLASNRIESIPPGALGIEHDALTAGVDLSDNYRLAVADLQRMLAYAERVGRDEVLGFSREEIRDQIDGDEPAFRSDSESEPDEELDKALAATVDRGPWLTNLPLDQRARCIELWDRLAAEPDNAAFFNLLSLLPHTQDFRLARASLTARVWRVMEAAGGDTELRKTLFAMSASHGTCEDGRILTFSLLEIKVVESDMLNGIDPTDLTRKGQTLLGLSRNLFRLDQVETLAKERIKKGDLSHDAAEVRLMYLIGFKGELNLEGVPQTMRFGSPISGTEMTTDASAIRALEKTDTFYQNLISHDYWVDYLKEQYPEDFAALEQRSERLRDQFEDEHEDIHDEAYSTGAETLNQQLQSDKTQTLIALSRRADVALNPVAHDPNQPGTSTGSTG